MKKFVLLGEKIDYSLSPVIHSHIYKHLKVNAQYSILSLTHSELEKNIDYLKTFDGFNVTQPHKTSIIKYLDAVKTPFSAVNTVKNEDGKLIGYNTDGLGFKMHLLESYSDLSGKTALIFGAGGMAAIAAHVLKDCGVKVIIQNRTYQRAVDLAAKVGGTAVECADGMTVDLIVNASSGGLFSDDFILPRFEGKLPQFAYDTIYFDTAFSKRCAENKIPAINGLGMLIYQAIYADEIFFDEKIDDIYALRQKIEKLILK